MLQTTSVHMKPLVQTVLLLGLKNPTAKAAEAPHIVSVFSRLLGWLFSLTPLECIYQKSGLCGRSDLFAMNSVQGDGEAAKT